MIGNDVIDLNLARYESSWKRAGFLEKIFTSSEQKAILLSENPEQTVWILWSKKEAVYKVYNRNTGVRAFIPLQLECENADAESIVRCYGVCYFTKTVFNDKCINTIASDSRESLKNIVELRNDSIIEKHNGLPFVYDRNLQKHIPVSVTHHGQYHLVIAPIKIVVPVVE